MSLRKMAIEIGFVGRDAQKELKKTDKAADEAKKSMVNLGKEATKAGGKAQGLATKLKAVQKHLDPLREKVNIVLELKDRASAKIRAIAGELAALEGIGKNLQQTGKSLESFGGNLTRKVTAPLVGAATALGAGLAKSGMDRAAFKEDLGVALTTMMGDAGKANAFIKELSDFSRKTPFAFPDLGSGARNLIAFGMEAEKVIPTMTAIGDAVAGIGGGGAELGSIADTFGKIQASGRLSMEEVNSLAVHGIPALQILANQAGITAEAMRDKIGKGAVDANTATTGLVKGIEEGTTGLAGTTAKFGGMMEKNQGTWRGALDKFKGAWSRAGEAIMTKEMPGLKESVQKLTGIMDKLPDIAGPAIGTVVGLLGKGADAVARFVTWFSKLDESTRETILKFAVLAVAIGPAISIIGKLTTGVGGMITSFGKVAKSIKTVGVLGTMFSPGNLIVLGILALVAAGYLLYKNWDKISAKAIELTNSIKEKIAPFIPYLQNIFSAVGAILSVGFTFIKGVLEVAFVPIKAAFTFAWEMIKNTVITAVETIGGVLGGLVQALSGIIDFVVGVFTADWGRAWQGVQDIFGGIFNGLKAIAQGAINGVIGIINAGISGINKLKAPDWVPGMGGKSPNIPQIPRLARGTNNFDGGLAMVGERGPELVSLPQGSRVTPHSDSMGMLRSAYSGAGGDTFAPVIQIKIEGGSGSVQESIPDIKREVEKALYPALESYFQQLRSKRPSMTLA